MINMHDSLIANDVIFNHPSHFLFFCMTSRSKRTTVLAILGENHCKCSIKLRNVLALQHSGTHEVYLYKEELCPDEHKQPILSSRPHVKICNTLCYRCKTPKHPVLYCTINKNNKNNEK